MTPRAKSSRSTSGPPRPAEDLQGYLSLFRDVFVRHGLPLAIYGDRLNVLVRNDPHWSLEEQLQGAQQPTHVGRILRDLGIGYIAARSPQAKGRIERLWATLQDRLVSELRLRRIASVDTAAYLPEFMADFNRRFGKPPATDAGAWRRPPRDLPLVLSCRYHRVVARDNTVRLGARAVQLRSARSCLGVRVEVRELLDGRLVVHDGAIVGQAPGIGTSFVLKRRRSPNGDRRRRIAPLPPRPIPAPRVAPKTHTAPPPASLPARGCWRLITPVVDVNNVRT